MPRRFVIAALGLFLLPLTALAQQPAIWVDACGRQWHVDGRNWQRIEVVNNRVVRRFYGDSVRYELAPQVEWHLTEVGIPPVGRHRVIDRREYISPRQPRSIDRSNGQRVAEQVPLPATSGSGMKPTPESLPAPPADQQTALAESRADALRRHLAETPERLLKANKYDRFETVEIGWYVDHDATIRPLDIGDTLAIGYLEAGSSRADLWHEGKSLHEYVLFARYYEDALELKRKHY